MILLTRLDRKEVILNSDLIESIEARPDTTIRLITGQSQVVRESTDEVLERIREWRTSLLARAGLAGLVTQPASRVHIQSELEHETERGLGQREVPA
jgi:flagellar protein FlbD